MKHNHTHTVSQTHRGKRTESQTAIRQNQEILVFSLYLFSFICLSVYVCVYACQADSHVRIEGHWRRAVDDVTLD